jgi:glyoxylate carboligase
MKQTAAKLKDMNKRMKSVPKRKKTLRRTYKIGKSKVLPRVSVLVSNRTIRNNISTKSQLLKQVDMSEVKKYLIKRGFIKVGSSAPNDVLRKMYEEAVLMCGELQNHNPENLLYNFMNQNES